LQIIIREPKKTNVHGSNDERYKIVIFLGGICD